MKIWFLEIGEPLPVEDNVRLLRYGNMTRWLASEGHDVTWWASSFSHAPKKHVAKGGTCESINGVNIHFLDGPGYKKNMSFARIKHPSETAKNLQKALAEKERNQDFPDLIVNPVPTLECGYVLCRFAKKHNIPYLVDIRDHWPEDYILKLPKILRPLGKLALWQDFKKLKFICSNAAGITGVTKLQRDYGIKYSGRPYSEATDEVIYIGYTPSLPDPKIVAEAKNWWFENGLKQDHKIFSFAGTLGISFDFTILFEAFRRLKKQGYKCQMIIAGDGPTRASYIKEAEDLGDTVLFPGWIKGPQISALMELSNFALAAYKPGTSMSFPNKFFEYMTYSLPILSSCSGESVEILNDSGCGVTYDIHDARALTASIKDWLDHPEKAEKAGKASKKLMDERFSTDIIYPKALSYFNKLANK